MSLTVVFRPAVALKQIREEFTMNDEFHFTPLMFWEDITFVLQLIAKFFKKIFGLDEEE